MLQLCCLDGRAYSCQKFASGQENRACMQITPASRNIAMNRGLPQHHKLSMRQWLNVRKGREAIHQT